MAGRLDGVVPVVKPPGMTSFGVVRYLGRLWHTRHIGHTGTLDPQATGLLLVCVGQATRLAEYFQHDRKAYVTELVLGVSTDTGDGSGTITLKTDPGKAWPGAEALQAALAHFTGRVEQVPPIYSAVRVSGRHGYEWARAGVRVEIPRRTVEIYRIDYVHGPVPARGRFSGWPAVVLQVECQAGTYIRSLCTDLGSYLGTGGHMGFLLRERVGAFSVGEAWTLEELGDLTAAGQVETAFFPMADALRGWPRVELPKEAARRLQYGVCPSPEEISLPDLPEGLLALMYQGELLAVARHEKGQLRLEKVLAASGQE